MSGISGKSTGFVRLPSLPSPPGRPRRWRPTVEVVPSASTRTYETLRSPSVLVRSQGGGRLNRQSTVSRRRRLGRKTRESPGPSGGRGRPSLRGQRWRTGEGREPRVRLKPRFNFGSNPQRRWTDPQAHEPPPRLCGRRAGGTESGDTWNPWLFVSSLRLPLTPAVASRSDVHREPYLPELGYLVYYLSSSSVRPRTHPSPAGPTSGWKFGPYPTSKPRPDCQGPLQTPDPTKHSTNIYHFRVK